MSFHKNNTVPHLIGGTVGHSQKILVHRYEKYMLGKYGDILGNPDEDKRKKTYFLPNL